MPGSDGKRSVPSKLAEFRKCLGGKEDSIRQTEEIGKEGGENGKRGEKGE